MNSAGFGEAMTKSGQTIRYLDGPAFEAGIEQVSRVIGDLVGKMPELRN